MLLGLFCMIITILLSGFFSVLITEKTPIIQKIENFDNENSGPVYDFIKNTFLFILTLGSFGCCFISTFIPKYVSDGMYTDALICFGISFLAGFVMYITQYFINK